MTEDDGHAISFKVLKRGTPVRSSDGVQVGTVRRAQETGREHIFDGIVIDTKRGKRFVDAPLTITSAEAAELPPPGGGMRARMDQATTVRRAKRMGRSWRDRWDRR